MSGKRAAALAWAARGFRCFPLQVNSKFPTDIAWTIHASSDPQVVYAMWTDAFGGEHDYNIGFCTTGWIVPDVDVKNGKPGLTTFFDLGMDFDTLTMQTPTGGYHLVYQEIDRIVGGSPLGEGIDVRSFNGYVVAPGSTIDGKAYTVAIDLPVAPFPEHLRDRLKSPRQRSESLPPDVELDTPELVELVAHWLRHDAVPAVEGAGGDARTYQTACQIRDYGISEPMAFELFIDEYNQRCSPPWEPAAARVKIENAYRYATGEIGSGNPLLAFRDVVLVEPPAALPDAVTAPWITDHAGRPTPVLANAALLLRTRPELDVFAFDEMARQALILRPLPSPPLAGADPGGAYPRPVRDTDVSRLQELLQHGGLHRISQDVVHQAVNTRAAECAYHPVRDYLNGLRWDGTARLATWLACYLGAEATAYHAGIGRMFLTAMVARIFTPGCKADYLLTFEGVQGAGKSTACEILAGEWFSDSLPDVTGEKEVAQHLRGKWLIEIAELAALGRAESERLKSFVSRTTERYRPPFGRLEVVEPRQCLFIGTTNRSTYLQDETGGRRFWPVKVGQICTVSLARDRDQLFAEAVRAYKNDDRWWPDAEFEAKHIRPQQEQRFESDAWEELITPWLESQTRVQVNEVARKALSLSSEKIGTANQRRISRILQQLGWCAVKDSLGRGYVKGMTHDAP